MFGYRRTNFAEREIPLRVHEKCPNNRSLKRIVFEKNENEKCKMSHPEYQPKISVIEPREVENRKRNNIIKI